MQWQEDNCEPKETLLSMMIKKEKEKLISEEEKE